MNLNHITPSYCAKNHSIILLDMRPHVLINEFRVVHQEVLDAVVQYMQHEKPPFCEQRITSLGKGYILRVTPCK